ncbi:MAG: GAF domain-containing protein [Anaerolineaceae bacterium]
MPQIKSKALISLISGTKMKHALFEAAHIARVVLKVESSIIFLLSTERELSPATWDGRDPAGLGIPLGSPYISSLWEGRRSISWENRSLCKDPHIMEVMDSMNCVSGLIVPLVSEKWNFGIWLIGCEADREFSESEESILAALRDNVCLTTESLLDSELIAKLQREAVALQEINKEISQQLDLNQVLKTIVEKTCLLLQCDLSYLSLADEKAKEVRVVITEGTRADELRKMVLKYGEGVGGLVAQTGQPKLVKSYTSKAIPKSDLVSYQASTEGIESIISVPMISRHVLVGVLFGASRKKDAFNIGQMDLLTSLGTQAAIAIENARLFEQEKVFAEGLSNAKQVNEKFLDLVLRNKGIQAIADTLAELVLVPIAIEDTQRETLVTAYPKALTHLDLPGSPWPKLTTSDIWWNKYYAEQVRQLRDGHHTVRISPQRDTDPRQSRMIAPVVAGNKLMGFVLALETDGELSENQITTLEQASIVVALEYLKLEVAHSVEQRLAGDFLEDLIYGRFPSEQAVINRATMNKVNLNGPQVVMILDFDNFSEAIYNAHWSDTEALDIKHHLLRVSEKVGTRYYSNIMAVIQSDSVVMLLPIESDKDRSLEIQLAKDIQKELQTLLPELTFSVGISQATRSISGIQSAFKEAETALRALRQTKKAGGIMAFEDLGLLSVLLQGKNYPAMQEYMQSQLSRLISYDQEKGTEFLQTLRFYLLNSGHLQKTAIDCNIHINTLKYRIQRIEEILETNLADGEMRFNLYLALSILRMDEMLKARE